jgi:ATP-dependent Lon protease
VSELSTDPALAAALPLLPLTKGVVLPHMVVTLATETEDARAAVGAAQDGDGRVLVVPRIEGRFATVGTVAQIEQSGALPSGTPAVVIRGIRRAQLGSAVASSGSVLWVHVDEVDEASGPPASSPNRRDKARELRALIEGIAEKRGVRRLVDGLANTDDAALVDSLGSWPDIAIERKITLLETLDLDERLELAVGWVREMLAELEIAEQIRNDVTIGMEKAQREFLLRQQLAAIRKELGDSDEAADIADEYRSKVAESQMPPAVATAMLKEVDRLERMSEQSPEHSWIRTWLDTMLEIPWGQQSVDVLDIEAARRVLDDAHTGLQEVKDRILEHLAVRKLRAERGVDDSADERPARRGGGAILALVGPPGVGKTSLGESVAEALGRSFVRVALGGVRDEAEIRGHRRTYVGAQPGRIARALREAGTMNPVVLLDEIDKLGADWRGDPSSALLEVLDPAQNHTFRDHYLEVDLDLSDVLFLATANVAETIAGPLLDRMEVVRLDGYTDDEKVAIGRDHLFPRQLARVGLRTDEAHITDDALRAIASEYTRESGVRNLERELAKLLRKVATAIASGRLDAPVRIEAEAVADYLGRPRFFYEAADRTGVPGVATGLAVTGMGGDVLFIEASAMRGETGLTLTGQLGDVMKESAQIALSWVRSHLDADADGKRFHLHVPAGAVPKDGPSAGITMTTALASLTTGRAVKPTIGMTGEVTLQGRVLPIGGVKQKVLAAHRAGLTEVILPARNGPDLDDVPEAVRESMTFHLVDDVSEVLDLALEAR